MNITPNSVYGMNPKDKEIYFKHMEKRHLEEKEYLEARKEEAKSYKESLIEDILKLKPDYPIKELQNKTTRTLERIYDYC